MSGADVRNALLTGLDVFRGTLDSCFGLRLYTVTVRVNTWTGNLAGRGTKTTVDTVLYVNGTNKPAVREVTQKDIIVSHGRYQDQDLRVGPLTPPFPDPVTGPNGTNINVFDPALAAKNIEVLFLVSGPGDTDGGGDWYKRVNQSDTHPLRYEIVLRRTGQESA